MTVRPQDRKAVSRHIPVNLLHLFPQSYFMNDIQILITELQKFRDERNWDQFHTSKDLALAISIEAAELNEIFLWKTTEEAENVDRNKLKEELADVLAFSLLLAGKHGFDVKEIVLEKIRKNGEKYPVEKSKGTAKKYDEL
jgi:NTP pyrophosphatase (non-canonical NTP hydrolase)